MTDDLKAREGETYGDFAARVAAIPGEDGEIRIVPGPWVSKGTDRSYVEVYFAVQARWLPVFQGTRAECIQARHQLGSGVGIIAPYGGPPNTKADHSGPTCPEASTPSTTAPASRRGSAANSTDSDEPVHVTRYDSAGSLNANEGTLSGSGGEADPPAEPASTISKCTFCMQPMVGTNVDRKCPGGPAHEKAVADNYAQAMSGIEKRQGYGHLGQSMAGGNLSGMHMGISQHLLHAVRSIEDMEARDRALAAMERRAERDRPKGAWVFSVTACPMCGGVGHREEQMSQTSSRHVPCIGCGGRRYVSTRPA